MAFKIILECDSCDNSIKMMSGSDISMTVRHRRMYAAKAYTRGWNSYMTPLGKIKYVCPDCIKKYPGTAIACLDRQYRE